MDRLEKKFNRDTINEVTVFHQFNLEIREGEFISIVGSNGSGKTTLLNLLCGSLPLDGGSIRLKGQPLERLPEYRRAAAIGRVFQDPLKGTCPSLTILENMSLAENKNRPFNLSRGINRRRIDYYKTQLELLHLGLEDKLHMPVGVLSGGQRQALALLISTLTPIELLVLDEHTAALDPKSSETVMELTDRVVREKKLTAVMVTHNLRFAVQYGSRLIMMDRGSSVIDSGADGKANYAIEDLLKVFNEISIECGN
ncbi:MAG: ATP-binding cassette domain-containing protein [Clostridiales bacterium]|nr:ATP-binding cassette domain-containing protein [Clostridiales bacterium]